MDEVQDFVGVRVLPRRRAGEQGSRQHNTLLWAPPPPPESNLNPPSGECLDGSCRNGEGKFEWGSGDVYEGGWDAEFRPHGKGLYVWHDGESYDGDWLHGLKEGEGNVV